MDINNSWFLIRNGKPLAKLDLVAGDMPWFICKIVTTIYFEDLRSLFKEFYDCNIVFEDGQRNEQWEVIRKKILSLKLCLIANNKESFSRIKGQKILMHIKEGNIKFRLSSSPNIIDIVPYNYFRTLYLLLMMKLH
jgi:hypothetical protein